ncbi:hypothetical protein POM88_050960 [Heracleum sosnowskyi]|uniref:Uncharacterized protein n=1 Tax=Heracleum sosnowskyi TaxID=360622 RepID=A0AAD8H0V5_9APIA|nr:hypothetical protein POM88_050960 [Heracleum sosnowskyi]
MGDNSYDLESSKSESPWAYDESSMLGVDNQSSIINNNVFPPINHEGLHIHSQSFPLSLHQFKPTTSPSKIPISRVNVTRCWNLWFKFMHRSIDYIPSRLLNYSLSSVISVVFSPVTVLLLVFWYLRVRRQRQRRALLDKSRDHLIRIVAQRDEEISKLMHQIAQMNKLLCGVATSSPRAT